MALPKWTDERTATLAALVVGVSPVTIELVNSAADTLETTTRSIASKLRKMGYEVQSASSVAKKAYSDAQEAELSAFVTSNSGMYTFGEIAGMVCGGDFSPKSIQGKLLSMELTNNVKATEKQVVAKAYSDAEEATFVEMAAAGSSAEDIAKALGKSLKSVMGKSLSLSRTVEGFVRPKQETSSAKAKEDAFDTLENIATMSVADIAAALDKSERGIKSMLTHRGVTCADYDGAKKAAKIAEKAA